MKVMSIGIKSHEEVMNDFKDTFLAVQNRLPVKKRDEVSFTSLAAARNFLTPKRMEILHTIREKNPASIYSLAKMTRRSFPAVLRDVETLTRHGLVKLTRQKKSPRHAVHPTVSYDAINLWISI